MTPINLDDVVEYVNHHIGAFHDSRIGRLQQIRLREVLKKKNPYLFRAKNLLTAERLVESMLVSLSHFVTARDV